MGVKAVAWESSTGKSSETQPLIAIWRAYKTRHIRSINRTTKSIHATHKLKFKLIKTTKQPVKMKIRHFPVLESEDFVVVQ